MKHLNKIYLMLMTAGLFYGNTSSAQNARLQVIHNASGILLDTVDVYLNGILINDLAFRNATALQTLEAGDYLFSINDRTSIDSSDQILFSQNISLGTTNSNVIVINGVEDALSYAVNPDSRATDVSIVHRKNVLTQASNGASSVTFIHGVTDAGALSIANRPNTNVTTTALLYGDSTNNIFPSAVNSAWDVRSGSTILRTYNAPLGSYNRKSLVVFTSGFSDPSTNQNGAAWTLLTADTNGVVTELQEVSRVQLINNSSDAGVSSIDVWVDNNKIATALAFRKATPFITIPAGSHDITVTQGNSADTSVNVITRFNNNFVSGKTYLGIAIGSTSDASFEMYGSQDFSEYSASGVDVMTLNGSADAPQLDINRTTPALTVLADDIAYKNNMSFVNTAANNGLIQITNNDGSELYGTYRLALSGKGGQTAVLLTSGMFSTLGSFDDSNSFRPIVVFNDGSVQVPSKLGSDVQFVHNSADSTIEFVDIYVNGTLTLDNFQFREATTFLSLDAFKNYTIKVADSASTSDASAFYTTTLTPDSSVNYYIILTGLKTPANYQANPDGRDISFKIVTYKGALKAATVAKNIDLLFYQGSTDLSVTTVRGNTQVQFLCKDKGYGEFHGYRAHSAEDNLPFTLTDTTGYNDELYANLKIYHDQAGLVLATGFKNVTGTQAKSPLYLMIVWADGNVDSIAPLRLIGMEEKTISENSFALYPNPATSQVNIAFEMDRNNNVSVQVIDITGRVALSKNVQATRGENKISVNVDELNRGLYFINMSSEGKSITKKLIVE